jgi:hypothetical protein
VVDVNEWERANAVQGEHGPTTRALTRRLAEAVRALGVHFKAGTPDECAAAVALLLFGNSDVTLPGGYASEDVSADSPIASVVEFPQVTCVVHVPSSHSFHFIPRRL